MHQEKAYPSLLLAKAVDAMAALPGIGERTALEHVLFLLSRPESETDRLTEALSEFRHGVKFCKRCHCLSDGEICSVCSSPSRVQSMVCVVENVGTVMSIEQAGTYMGVYHVLGGLISPANGVGPGELQVESLVERVHEGGIDEVCFALSPTMEGDTTAFYLWKKLSPLGVKITMIARGVVPGDRLQYVDSRTLARSIEDRHEFTVGGRQA